MSETIPSMWSEYPVVAAVIAVFAIQLSYHLGSLIYNLVQRDPEHTDNRNTKALSEEIANEVTGLLDRGETIEATKRLIEYNREDVREYLINLVELTPQTQLSQSAIDVYYGLAFDDSDQKLAEDSKLSVKLPAIARMSLYRRSIPPEKLFKADTPEAAFIEILLLDTMLQYEHLNSAAMNNQTIDVNAEYSNEATDLSLNGFTPAELKFLLENWECIQASLMRRSRLEIENPGELVSAWRHLREKTGSDQISALSA